MSNNPGLNSADLRAKSSVQLARRNPATAAGEDAIQEALRVDKELTANRIMRRSVSELEVDDLKAKTEKVRTQVELQNLTAQLKGDDRDAFMNQVVTEIQDIKRQISEQRESMTTKELVDMKEAMGALVKEIEGLKGAQGSTMQSIKGQIQEATELLDIIRPPSTALVPSGSEDRVLEAYRLRTSFDEKKLDLEAQKLRWEREDRLDIARAEIDSKERIAQKELELKQEHFQQQDRFLTETVPKLIPLGEKAISALGNKAGGAQAAPMVQLPDGVLTATCQQCGVAIYYREGTTHVICQNPNCLAEYNLKDGDDEPPASE